VSAADIRDVFNKDAQLQRNLNSTLVELRRSAKSLRLLADYLERHPESIIQGKKR
jgi:paraquat-inducible protein B